jgi:uridine kinase
MEPSRTFCAQGESACFAPGVKRNIKNSAAVPSGACLREAAVAIFRAIIRHSVKEGRVIVIGIAGGTASGKTTVVRSIYERLPGEHVSRLPQDSYYKDMSHLPMEERLKVNYDHPDVIEFDLLHQHILALKSGQAVEVPIYDYVTCTRTTGTQTVLPQEIVIVEGIMIMLDARIRQQMDIKIFVDTDADDRLIRRIRRDVVERGRTVDSVLEAYETRVKPMHSLFIEPTKRYADLIIPQGGSNHVAIDVLTSMIHAKLHKRAYSPRSENVPLSV